MIGVIEENTKESMNQLANSVAVVAKRLCVSQSTVRTLIYSGRLKAIKLGQRVLVLEKSLQLFLGDQEEWEDWKKDKSEK